ncbi:hypothetical protein BTR19_20795 [Pseudomonas fluorescens]|nr:hypothetical protein BTR19_20795 [Pseudomonas fluorescens]
MFELVGLAQAKKILFTGQRLNAAEAQKIGLVDEVCEGELSLAHRMGQVLSGNAPRSISGAKTMLNSLCANVAPLAPVQVAAILDQAASSEDYACLGVS